MALFHRATITPTKDQLVADWAPRHPWGPPRGQAVELVGSYRFDDPNGRVGMECFIARAGEMLLHVPVTYRDEPLAGVADDALICEMHHSVLGTRWVYDGLRDPALVTMLAAVSMTGQGEALGMAVNDDRWYIAPAVVRVHGGGWSLDRVPVDGFELVTDEGDAATLRSDRFELTVFRRPAAGARPAIGLNATWPGQERPVVLTAIEVSPT